MAAPDEDDEDDDAPPGLPPDAPFVMSPEGHAALAEEAAGYLAAQRERLGRLVADAGISIE